MRRAAAHPRQAHAYDAIVATLVLSVLCRIATLMLSAMLDDQLPKRSGVDVSVTHLFDARARRVMQLV